MHVIYGSATGLGIPGNKAWYEDLLSGDSESGDDFGWALAAGDFDCDGYDDLTIGIPDEDLGAIVDAGAVTVAWGSPGGLGPRVTDEYWHQDRAGVSDRAQPDDRFGYTLAAGDGNLDGCDDLAIGVPDEDVLVDGSNMLRAGLVNVLYGSLAGLVTDSDQDWYQGDGVLGRAEGWDQFGYALAAASVPVDLEAYLPLVQRHD